DSAVRKGDGGRIPALVLHVGWERGIGVGFVERVAVRGNCAAWISLPSRPHTGRTPPNPLFSLRIKDVDLPAAVVSPFIVEAEDVDATVGPRLLAHAEEVVAEPPGVAGVLEERVSERHVRVGKRCDARRAELLRVDSRLDPGHLA